MSGEVDLQVVDSLAPNICLRSKSNLFNTTVSNIISLVTKKFDFHKLVLSTRRSSIQNRLCLSHYCCCSSFVFRRRSEKKGNRASKKVQKRAHLLVAGDVEERALIGSNDFSRLRSINDFDSFPFMIDSIGSFVSGLENER